MHVCACVFMYVLADEESARREGEEGDLTHYNAQNDLPSFGVCVCARAQGGGEAQPLLCRGSSSLLHSSAGQVAPRMLSVLHLHAARGAEYKPSCGLYDNNHSFFLFY